MDFSEIQYFKLIGEAVSAIEKSESLEEAIRLCFKKIIDGGLVDYAVSWYYDDNGKKQLRPYYWVCPIELTQQTYQKGEGTVGKTFETEKSMFILDFQKESDQKVKEIFNGISVSSYICIPFALNDKPVGCVEFIRTAEHGIMNEDEANICDILSLVIQMNVNDQYARVERKDQEVLVSLRNVHKYYKQGDMTSHVLKGFNLDVFKGETLCFLGVSGCGKSTLLNILGGLLKFEEGSVLFEGKELKDASKNELSEYRRENIGFVYQSYNLMPNLNVKHNIELIGELIKDPLDALELLSMVGLKDKAYQYPAKLSGGQKQRVAVARAMVKHPKLILADEPTSALDYKTSLEVLEAFQMAKANGTTIIIVTHNEEIAKIADRIVRFRDGKMYETTINSKPKKPSELIW